MAEQDSEERTELEKILKTFASNWIIPGSDFPQIIKIKLEEYLNILNYCAQNRDHGYDPKQEDGIRKINMSLSAGDLWMGDLLERKDESYFLTEKGERLYAHHKILKSGGTK